MKKIYSLLLVFTMIFSLCACGGGNKTTTELSKEEMLTQAEELKLSELYYELYKNEVRAQTLYNGKLVRINDFEVNNISLNKLDIVVTTNYWSGRGILIVSARLPYSDGILLNTGDIITVVGTLNVKSSSTAALNDAFIVTE